MVAAVGNIQELKEFPSLEAQALCFGMRTILPALGENLGNPDFESTEALYVTPYGTNGV